MIAGDSCLFKFGPGWPSVHTWIHSFSLFFALAGPAKKYETRLAVWGEVRLSKVPTQIALTPQRLGHEVATNPLSLATSAVLVAAPRQLLYLYILVPDNSRPT